MSDNTNKPTRQEIETRAAQLVQHDVYLCLSTLISELLETSEDLSERISELSYVTCNECDGEGDDDEGETCHECAGDGSVYHEIYEHWAVSSLLARDLEKRDEVIIREWGLCVWGRTTTGQSIALDYVIRSIARDLLSR